MSKFCKKCGAGLEEGTLFCESCGAPVQAVAKNEQSVRPAEIVKKQSISGNKLMLAIGSSVIGLILLAAGVWILTGAPGKPSEERLSALLNADNRFKSRTVCLGNFQYDHAAANVNTGDQTTQQWFGILVAAGLYSAPQIVTTGGWLSRELFQYTPTDKGKLAIKNGRLCFAQGVVLDKVTYGDVQQVQNKSYATAEYTYHFLNAEDWTKRPETKHFAADVFGQDTMTDKLVVERADKEWVVSDIPADSLSIIVAARQAKPVRSDSTADGFLAGLTNLFSGLGGNPLIGKWRNSISGETVEFTATDVIGSRGRAKINYEVKGNQVNLTNSDTLGVSMCTVTDSKHMTMVEAGRVYQFNRINN